MIEKLQLHFHIMLAPVRMATNKRMYVFVCVHRYTFLPKVDVDMPSNERFGMCIFMQHRPLPQTQINLCSSVKVLSLKMLGFMSWGQEIILKSLLRFPTGLLELPGIL